MVFYKGMNFIGKALSTNLAIRDNKEKCIS